MSLSSILIGILILLFFSILISFLVISKLRPSMVETLTPNYGDMNEKQVGSAGKVRDLFMVPPSSTILIYIKCKLNNKTSSINTDAQPVRIIELENSLKLLINPGNIQKPQTTTLVIKTQDSNNAASYETFPIKNFPEQKWVQLAIVREGRRYTVYYNGVVVLSKRTLNYPTINSSQFIIGDLRLSGTYVYPRIIPTEYHINDILDDLKKTSDTRNKPILPTDNVIPNLSKFLPNIGCPNGMFCFSTAPQPAFDPLKKWKTPYA